MSIDFQLFINLLPTVRARFPSLTNAEDNQVSITDHIIYSSPRVDLTTALSCCAAYGVTVEQGGSAHWILHGCQEVN